MCCIFTVIQFCDWCVCSGDVWTEEALDDFEELTHCASWRPLQARLCSYSHSESSSWPSVRLFVSSEDKVRRLWSHGSALTAVGHNRCLCPDCGRGWGDDQTRTRPHSPGGGEGEDGGGPRGLPAEDVGESEAGVSPASGPLVRSTWYRDSSTVVTVTQSIHKFQSDPNMSDNDFPL